MSNFISYANILNDRSNFQKSGTKSGSEFNYVDSPSTKYFKICFYFYNGDSDGSGNTENSGGLLAPAWEWASLTPDKYYTKTTAWTYLKLNDEEERANLLKQFIILLSDISSQSPWYFSEISGLEEAVDRKNMERDFKFDEQRKKLVIKCLPDAFDDRIGTLLDLYRAITWSWSMKREILPANLRKFDMGIFIFNDPVLPFLLNSNMYNGDNSSYKASYKYLEFHNCEFNYNSTRESMGSLTNKEGTQFERNIEIFYDDCYENRYNEFLMADIGDFIKIDTNVMFNQAEDSADLSELEDKMNYYSNLQNVDNETEKENQEREKIKNLFYGTKKENSSNGLIRNAVNEVVGVAKDAALGLIKRAVLGNLYTFSLSRIGGQLQGALQGHVWSTARGVAEYVNDASNRKQNKKYINKIGNLFESQTIANNL